MGSGFDKSWQAVVATLFALLAFASNSLLCRAALSGPVAKPGTDPVSFTLLRLVSAALVLSLLVRRGARVGRMTGDWGSALALFSYALFFSLAYVRIDVGTGALILFGAVQVTMFGSALVSVDRPGPAQWLGLAVAVGGLVHLVSPGLRAPAPVSALMMLVAGISWGAYSLRAPADNGALSATAGNFVRTLPLATLTALLFRDTWALTAEGALLACGSGAIASGLGYVSWYAALRMLRTTSASLVQLSVPLLAAVGGVLLLGETMSRRLVISAALTVGGIAFALLARMDRN